MADQVFDLRRVRARVAGRVIIADGTEHDVIQPTSAHVQELRSGKGDLFAVAKGCVPSVPADYVMYVAEAEAIIQIAMANIEDLEKMFPNANRPEATP